MKQDIDSFQSLIWSYYTANKRDLPWRNTRDPYKILASEFMLQQTQISRVLPKYASFLLSYPTIKDLSKASVKDILAIWQGLGYNRRALHLLKTAQILMKDYKGIIPMSVLELIQLPGIGHYTASAVITFSANLPLVFIETNIRTVFLHHFFQDQQNVHDSEVLKLIEKTLDRENPREWYYALMDYGAYLKKAFGNSNQRSKHYEKQSKFEGSERQLRGIILRELVNTEYLTIDQIQMLSRFPLSKTELIVRKLLQDGLISPVNGKYSISKATVM